MKRISSKLVGLILVGMSSVAMSSAAVLAVDAPTTAPAPVTQAAPDAKPIPRVEVFPFTSVAGQPIGQDWTGRGIQESLQSDVSHTGATLLMAPHILAATDDSITLAKQNHADLVVIGTYQIVGEQIRANGQLIDVATNTPVGGFSATGSQHDLFKIEDALGEQLRGLLPRPIPLAQLQQQFEQPPPAPTIVYEQPAATYTPPPVQTVYNNYYDTTPTSYYPNAGYTYPYYDYGYYGGFGFYPSVVIGFGHDHDGDRGRDRDHDGDGFRDHGFVGGGRAGTIARNNNFLGNSGGFAVGRPSGGFAVGRPSNGFGVGGRLGAGRGGTIGGARGGNFGGGTRGGAVGGRR